MRTLSVTQITIRFSRQSAGKDWLDMSTPLPLSFRLAYKLGICPFDSKGKTTKFRFWIGVAFHAITWLSIIGQVVVDGSIVKWRMPSEFNFHYVFSVCRIIFLIITVAVNFYWYLYNGKAVQDLLTRLSTIARDIGPVNTRKHLRYISDYDYYLTVLLASLPIYFLSLKSDELGSAALKTVNVLFFSVAISYFYCLLKLIRDLLEQLNVKALKRKDLEHCAEVHTEICKLTREINRIHSFQMTFFIAENLIIGTTRIFEGLSGFLRYFRGKSLSRLFEQLIDCDNFSDRRPSLFSGNFIVRWT